MAGDSNLAKVIEESCRQINDLVQQKGAQSKSSEVIRDVVENFFQTLHHSGYGMEVNDLIDRWVEKRSNACLELARESVDSFRQSNAALQDITHSHTIEIDRVTSDERHAIDVSAFKSRFEAFQKDLLCELERANQIIEKLEKEIEELQRQSNIDPLTKLYNRKALQLDAEELLKYSAERKLDIVAMMIDADDFKMINDTFGHVAGDKVLILLAKLIRSSIRETDKAYRYGGEEFLILFNRARLKDVVHVASRIMKTVRENKIIYKNRVIRVTLSIGMTEHQKGDTLESLIDRADAAVYEAKKAGKDRLVVK